MRNIEIGSDGRGIVIESSVATDFVMPIYPIGVQETLTTAAPAVSIATYLTNLDATAQGVASTLADGSINGQMKRIQASVVSGGTTNVTLASAESAALDVITFTVIGDRCDLMWYDQDDDGAGYWKILSRSDTDGDLSTPTVA